MNSYEKFHLKEVINASGKMTILGVSKVSEAVLAAQRFGGEHFFEMSELSLQTGAFFSQLVEGRRCPNRFLGFGGDCPIGGCLDWKRQLVPRVSSLYRKDRTARDCFT